MRRLCAAVALLAAGLAGCDAAPPPQRVVHGPFEIELTPRRIGSGSFPNQGGNPFATREVTDFSVRWRGQPVGEGGQVGGRVQRHWRVLRLPDAPRPALLLVNTGFVLLSERDGRLEQLPLRAESASLAEAQWLDAGQGQPGPSQRWGIQHEPAPEAGTVLAGGRWLRLGSRTVLDVATLTAHEVSPWVPYRPGEPVHNLSREGDEARAFSPGRSAYVLAASGYAAPPSQGRDWGLLVVDIASGTAEALRIDRRRQRFADADDMTPAWIAHHFDWQRGADGRERLRLRPDARPWPWRSRRWQIRPGVWQLSVRRIDPRFQTVVQALAERVDGACPLRVAGLGEEGGPDDKLVSAWAADEPRDEATRQLCAARIERLAAAVDVELASGRHDALLQQDDDR